MVTHCSDVDYFLIESNNWLFVPIKSVFAIDYFSRLIAIDYPVCHNNWNFSLFWKCFVINFYCILHLHKDYSKSNVCLLCMRSKLLRKTWIAREIKYLRFCTHCYKPSMKRMSRKQEGRQWTSNYLWESLWVYI